MLKVAKGFLLLNLLFVSQFLCGQTRDQLKEFSPLPFQKKILVRTTETTNGEYLKFINAMRVSKTPAEVARLLPDTLQWASTTGIENNTLGDYYFSHPGFKDYPIASISHEAAVAYCEWLTAGANKINDTGKGVYKKVQFRLPTEAEWQLAAAAKIDKTTRDDEPILPWSEYPYWNFPDGKGKFRANTKFATGVEMPRYTFIEDGFVYTAPVKTFAPNDIGLYQVIGNVAEMIDQPGVAKGGSWNHSIEECLIIKRTNYGDPSPMVGVRIFLEIIQ